MMFLASYGIAEVFSGVNDLGGDRQAGPRLNNNLFLPFCEQLNFSFFYKSDIFINMHI